LVKKQPHAPADGHRAEEQALVDDCRAGDPRAFEQFFRAHVGRVERVVGNLVGATPDLEDLVQTTFVEALRSFPRFRGEASLATWITRIAVHIAHRQLRQGVRRHLPLELLPSSEEPRSEMAVESLDSRRIAPRLHQALDRISPKKRIAFLLYAVEGYSMAEVAAITRAGRAATKARIWFARRELLAAVRQDPVLSELARRLGRQGQ
jgi:RNA polymerase sigma-70 factor (ECF subfamily)